MSDAADIISGRMSPTDLIVKNLRTYSPMFSQFQPGVVAGYSQTEGRWDLDHKYGPYSLDSDGVDLPRVQPGKPFVHAMYVGPVGGLPTAPAARKRIPLATGLLDYFPDALAAVAEVSRIGNEQHHPGQPLHWDRAKSTDEADALLRHFIDRGKMDGEVRHTAKVAWRALAMLQKEIEADTGVMASLQSQEEICDRASVARCNKPQV
jgi:hypothetical protein